jgi:hypothetical protein
VASSCWERSTRSRFWQNAFDTSWIQDTADLLVFNDKSGAEEHWRWRFSVNKESISEKAFHAERRLSSHERVLLDIASLMEKS